MFSWHTFVHLCCYPHCRVLDYNASSTPKDLDLSDAAMNDKSDLTEDLSETLLVTLLEHYSGGGVPRICLKCLEAFSMPFFGSEKN